MQDNPTRNVKRSIPPLEDQPDRYAAADALSAIEMLCVIPMLKARVLMQRALPDDAGQPHAQCEAAHLLPRGAV